MGEIDDLEQKAEEAAGPTPDKVPDAEGKDHQVRGSLGEAAKDLTDEMD